MIIQLPNGETAEFPDGMDIKEIESVLQKQFSAPSAQTPVPQAAPTDPMAESLGMFQPGNLAPSMETIKEQAPVAGAMVTAPFRTSPILAPIAGMGASAAALMAGQGTEPMMQGQTPDVMAGSLGQFNAPLGSFAVGAGSQALVGPVNKILGKTITAPFAKLTEKTMAKNALAQTGQELVEQGIPISPDLISPSKTSRALNWTLENLWPANSIMASKRKEIYNAASQLKDQFAKKYGVGTTSKEITDTMWDNIFSSVGGPETTVPMHGTIESIKSYMTQPFAQFDPKWQKYFKTFAEQSQSKPVTLVDKASHPLYTTKRSMDTVSDEPIDLFSDLVSRMKEIKTIGKTEQSLEGSYRNLQSIRDFLSIAKPSTSKGPEKTAINDILKNLENDFLTHDTIHGTSLAEQFSLARQESRNLARLQPIERILNQSITKPEGLDAGLFSPAQFVQKWEAIKGKVGARMDAADIKKVDDFALKMKAMIPDIKRLGEFEAKQKTPLLSGAGLKAAPGTAVGALGGAVGMPLLLVPMGAEVPLAYSIMNPTGIMRKWLTTGFNLPNLPTRVGLMKAGEEYVND